MPLYKIARPKDVIIKKGDDGNVELLSNTKFKSFNPEILGLGDLSLPSIPNEAVVTIFDLAGFTNFCKQVDPHLAIPEFLNTFLTWLFENLRDKLVSENHDKGVELYSDPPFFAKFMGDGLLLLWDAAKKDGIEICNIVSVVLEICSDYAAFCKLMQKNVSSAPPLLRCGVARGQVLSVGNGNDFVGPCINIASRLQKLGPLNFAVSRRGFDFEKYNENLDKIFVIKKVNIRGIGENELVYINKVEFSKLSAEDRKIFADV